MLKKWAAANVSLLFLLVFMNASNLTHWRRPLIEAHDMILTMSIALALVYIYGIGLSCVVDGLSRKYAPAHPLALQIPLYLIFPYLIFFFFWNEWSTILTFGSIGAAMSLLFLIMQSTLRHPTVIRIYAFALPPFFILYLLWAHFIEFRV